jgi:hypothetical protein
LQFSIPVDEEISAALSRYQQVNERFQDSDKYAYYSRMLHSTLRSEYERVGLLNQEKLLAQLRQAGVVAREGFIDAFKYGRR